MKIWLAKNAPDPGTAQTLTIGVWSDDTAKGAGLVTLRAGDKAPDKSEAALIAPGQTLAPDLLDALEKTRGDVYAPVNGLSNAGLAVLRARLGAERLVLTYDRAADTTALEYFEQLAWLSRQEERFAIIAGDPDAMLQAALAGAEAILTGDGAAMDFGPLARIAAQRRDDAARPIGPSEADALAGRELCLTVSRPLSAGAVIAADDLDVALTEYRGLSPALADKIAGCTLRYDITPGEALHFGHIK